MFKQADWITRKFNFDYPVDLYPGIVERLRGTPVRLEEFTRGLSEDVLTRKIDDKWSIKEHCGHLSQVDGLWAYRFNEFLEGKTELFAADLSGKQTDSVDFNTKPIAEILTTFREGRAKLLATLDAADRDLAARVAHHPRLDQPMRWVDQAFFAAEHDDQHLAAISELKT